MSRILETNNYDRFVLSPFNRNIRQTWNLEASFKKYGYRDSEPIEVKRLENGRLEIQEGHHRFYVCRKLGIPVKYVEVKDSMTRAERGKTVKPWTLQDYLDSYVKMGLSAYREIKKYHERTKIVLSSCISMLAGDSAGSGNWNNQFKDGTYRLADPAHANIVADISAECQKCGCDFFANQNFIFAVSKIAWAEDFDPLVMQNKIALFFEYLKKQPTKADYVRLLEEIYNRHSQTKVPLAFQAEEAAKKRNFGLKGKRKVRSSPENHGATAAAGETE